MRRIALLLLAFAMPICLQSQTKEHSNSTASTPNKLNKTDLIGMDIHQLIELGYVNAENLITDRPDPSYQAQGGRADCFEAYIPVDQSTYTPVPRNDDGFLFIPNIPFVFSFCGSSYTSLFINTNGNITFNQGVGQFSPDGFPYNVPMVAPFWADVDTRNTSCGQAWYRIFPNYMIVSWEDVGWFNQNCSPLNTFQLIISDGTAPIIGIGNNIQFRYGDMNWTTGTASGGGPFGGTPATVGYNSGDNINFEQFGRFNQDNANYDGPDGANDGVHYLDFTCQEYDADGGSFTLDCIDITRSLDANCSVNITVDDVASSLSDGCATVELSLDINSFGCNNIGPNVVTVTATTATQTETCTAIVNIIDGLCSAPFIDPVPPICSEDNPIVLNANPFGGTWGGAAPTGVFDPSQFGPGVYNVTYTNPNSCPTMTSIDIVVNANPAVFITPDPPEFCESDNGIPLTANASGGDGNYSYLWTTPSGNQIGETIPALFPGLYTVSVTDGNGCGVLEFINVVVNPDPVVVIFDPGPICNTVVGIQLEASPTGGVWSGPFVTPEGFIFPESMPPGITQVTYSYTNSFNCEASTTQDIQIVPTPDALASNSGPYCEGQTIELFGSTTAPGVATYSWTGPNGYTSNQQNPTDATEAGAYILEVSLNGCPSQLTPTIVNLIDAPIVIASNTGPYCPGQTISLIGSTTATGLNVTYEWAGPNGYTSFEQSPTDAVDEGNYTLVVNVDGCLSMPENTLVEFSNAPLAIADNTGPYCLNDPFILIGSTSSSGTLVTYAWTGPNGYTSNQQNPTDATEPGFYLLEVDVDGCTSDIVNTEIIVNPPPMPIIVGDATFCQGENTILDAGAGYTSYQWSTGATAQSTLVLTSAAVSVTVTDVNGCTGESIFVVTENPNPQPSILGSTSFCTGSATLLDAGDGYTSYLWSNGEMTQTTAISTPGTYTVQVTDANGCTGTDLVDITENNSLTPAIVGDLELCQGENSTLDAGAGFVTYLWTDGSETQEITVSATGDYGVTVTDINGCSGENIVSVTVSNNPTPTINGNSDFCEGTNTELDAGDGYATYIWSTGASNQLISVDATGTYIVTVTNTNGCTGEAQFSVIQNTNPIPVITGDDAFCEDATASLDAGGGYASYLWSETSISQTIEVSVGATYSVIVTDANGCTGEAQFIVDENTIAPPAIDGDLSFCEGSSTLEAGAGYNTYAWSTGDSDQTITINQTDDYSVTVTDANGCTAENQVSVTVFDNPIPEITGTDTFCEGDGSTLDAGDGYSTYSWSDASANQTLEVSVNGTYSVTITDTNGCTGEDDINITTNPNPVPTIAGSTSFCSGFSTILDAGNGYITYAWSDGSFNSTLEVSVGGTFSVTVTDASGCTGETSLTVVESSSLNPVISGDIEYCIGSTTVLDAGAGFETYAWSDGSSSQTITVDNPDDYSVTVTDINGCSGETTVSIIENQAPALTITGNAPICTGETIMLDAGTGFDAYEWSDASLNQDLEVNTGGVYSVIVTDANGCTNEASVTVLENANPSPSIVGNTSFCSGETVTLDAGAFDQYLWSDGSDSATLDISTGGTYTVTVTNTNGCTGEDQITIAENQLPSPQIAGTLDFCTGATTTLSAPSGFDYAWSNGETTESITLNTGGPIGLTVTDVFGCTGEASVNLTENTNPEPMIAGSTTFCIGTSTTIDAGPGYTDYVWSNGNLNQTLVVDMEGDYFVTVTDANGCTGIAQTSITESLSLQPVIAGDNDLCAGETSTFDAGAGFETYDWSNGSSNQTISVDTEGDYSVTVSDAQGCTGETMLSLTVNQNPLANIDGLDQICEGEISILDAEAGYDTYAWSTGETTQTIEVTTSDIFSVTVTDMNGCEDEAQLEVSVNPLPLPEILGASSFCSGNEVTLDAGSGYDTYAWSNGEATQMITVNAGDLYSVTVSSAAGCTAEDFLEVTENSSLMPTVLGDLEFCVGDNSTLDAGAGYATYAWSTGELSQTITVTENGNYGVLVTDADGCSGTANVLVTTFPNPEPIIAGSTTFCTGSSTTLDAGNYESFVWSNGETTSTISVNAPGTYTVDVIDINGCRASTFVEVTESTSLNPVISGQAAICTGGMTTLDAGAGFATYLWSDGSSNQTLDVFNPDDYSVTVSDPQGCTGETTVTVIENIPPETQFAAVPELCNTSAGGSTTNLFDLIIAGDATGTWEDTDNSGANGLFDNLDFNGVVPGSYTFTYRTNSALMPCTEVSYPIVLTIQDCACPGVSFSPTAPLCNSGSTLDLNSLINTAPDGTWAILTTPAGSNPAILTGAQLNATAADAGTYNLQYTLNDATPTGCPQIFEVAVSVEDEVFAGTAELPVQFCADDAQDLILSDLLNGEEAGGIWTEVSSTPSQNGAFNPSTGGFDMTGQASGIYNFEYTINPGGVCPEDREMVTVVVNELPIAIAGTSIELNCDDPVLSLDATGSSVGANFQIEWTGGVLTDGNENTLSPNVDQAGIYNLTVTNLLTGCAASDQVEVRQSADIPSAFAGNDAELTCNTTALSLQASGDVGTGFEIEWSGPSITMANMNEVNPMVDLAGMYILNVTDLANGCTSAPDTVIISNNIAAPIFVIELSPVLDCDNTEVELIGGTSQSDVSFEWLDETGDTIGNTISVDGITDPGFYTLVVTDNLTGCSGSETVEIIENLLAPIAAITPPDLLNCYLPEIDLDGSPSQDGASITYTWSGPGVSGAIDSEMSSATLPGVYTLIVVDTNNGCESSASITVDQDITPPTVAIVTPEQLDCTIEEVTLESTGSSIGNNFTYAWLDEQGATIATAASTDVEAVGTYTLSIQNTINGCVNTELVEVSENEDVPSSVPFRIEDPRCFGDDNGTIVSGPVVGGTSPYLFSINGEDLNNNGFYPNLPSGTYEIALQDANGCLWDTIIILNDPLVANLDLGGNIDLEMGDSAIVNASVDIPTDLIDTIIWTPSNLIECGDPDCLEVGFSSFSSQNVTATLIDVNGCRDFDEITVRIDRTKRIFIPNIFTPNGDEENDLFMIFGDEEQVVNINKFMVFTRWGETLYEGFNFSPNDPSNGWDGTYRGETVNPAVFVYLAEIEFIDGEVILYKGDVTLVR